MKLDFKPFYEQYEALLVLADSIFDKVEQSFPECVKCKTGCSDCCYALFDVSLIEALYLNHKMNETFSPERKSRLMAVANKADRQAYKIKRKAYKENVDGKDESEILNEMAEKRIRCPLLDDQDLCMMYDHRPLTCRFYGIPTSIAGKSHTCGLSGFEEGGAYPTVSLNVIQDKLYAISNDLVRAIGSKYARLGDLLVPVSTAILTEYTDAYLGIPGAAEDQGDESQTGDKNE